MSSKVWFELSVLFLVLMIIYNLNFRPVSSGDCVPARLLPFSILQEGNLDLDEFSLIPREASELPNRERIYVSTGGGGSWREVPGTYRRFSHLTAVRDTKGQLLLFARSQDGVLWEGVWTKKWKVKWQEIPGGVRTPSRPATVQDGQGQIRVLIWGPGSTIWENVKKGGRWSGWQQLPGATLSEPALVRDGEGRVRLFVHGLDHSLYENRLEEGRWGEWHQLPGGGGTFGPSVVVDPQGTLWLFVRGADTYVWQRSGGEAGWSEWKKMPESATTSRPEAALDEGGKVRVFIRGLDTHIYQSVGDPDGWSGWEELPGSGSAADAPSVFHNTKGRLLISVHSLSTEVPKIYASTFGGNWEAVPGGERSVSGPAVIRDQEGKTRLFVLGSDSGVWENVQDKDGWQGWKRLPGETASQPGVVMDKQGQLWLFVRGLDSGVYYAVPEAWGWSKWENVPGSFTLSFPAATVDTAGRIWLSVRGHDNTLYYTIRDSHGWRSWQAVPGGFTHSAPAVTVDPEGRLWLFIRGSDDTVQYTVRDAQGWKAWEWVPDILTPYTPAVVENATELFVGWEGGSIFRSIRTHESWSGWEDGGGGTLSGPAVALDTEGKPRVFVRGFTYTPYSVQEIRGHWMSSYPVVVPMVISPLYFVPVWLMDAYSIAYTGPEFDLIVSLMEKLSASLIATLSALFFYLTTRSLCSRRQAIGLTLIYALGTNTWTIGSQALWQHGMSELALSLMTFALLRAAGNERSLVWAGLGATLATANRPPNVLFALLTLAYVWQYHRKRTLLFLLFPAVIAPLFLTYNLYYFGSLLGGYGWGNWRVSWHEGLLGLLVSPNRGLFIYTPVTLFSLWGMGLLWQKPPSPQTSPATSFLRYMSIAVCGQIFLYARWFNWWGGHCFGPRLLTDILPFLCLFLVPIRRLMATKRSLYYLFFAAVAFSVAAQVVGAFFYEFGQWETSPVSVDSNPERLWDWRDTQIWRSLRSGLAFTLYPQIMETLKKVL